MEERFFTEACRHLDAAAANSDRLIDAIRAAMLLSAYAYTNNRHHEVSCLDFFGSKLWLTFGLILGMACGRYCRQACLVHRYT